jgi:hypothetical protein
VAAQPRSPRALPAGLLGRAARSLGLPGAIDPDPRRALEQAAGSDGVVLATGSLYLGLLRAMTHGSLPAAGPREKPHVVMHWRAPSAVMSRHAAYADVVAEVRAELRREGSSAAVSALAAAAGASCVRVHNVPMTLDAVRIAGAIGPAFRGEGMANLAA